MSKQALSGIRVLECAELISGPFCAKLLGDLGAEVIKVERPLVGDQARQLGPFKDDVPHPERSGLFLSVNTSKKGVTLDLETETGRTLFEELVKRCDILVENNPPWFMEERGLSYEELQKVNPRLIMVSITPFGQSGPYRDFASSELVTFHMSGLGYETPRATDPRLADLGPLKGGGYFGEFFAAVNGAGAALCALYARRGDGLGQHVDISAQECLMALLRRPIGMYAYDGEIATRFTYTWKVAPHHFMQCKDGPIFASIVEEHQWMRLLEVMGNPEWGQDPRFVDGPSRLQNWPALEPLLSKWLAERTKDEVWTLTQAQGIPFAPVNNMADLVNCSHLKERGMFIQVEHADAGRVALLNSPYKFSETPAEISKAAPLLGEHNEAVYCGLLGHTKAELVKMREAGVI